MVRCIGKAVYRVDVMLACLVGVLLAVLVGYLGIFLHGDGLVAAASILAVPFILLMPVCILVPIMAGCVLWMAIRDRMPRVRSADDNLEALPGEAAVARSHSGETPGLP